jgi:hypothetical protein
MSEILWINDFNGSPAIVINNSIYEIDEEKLNYICDSHLICNNRQECNMSFLHAKDTYGRILHVSIFAIKRMLRFEI